MLAVKILKKVTILIPQNFKTVLLLGAVLYLFYGIALLAVNFRYTGKWTLEERILNLTNDVQNYADLFSVIIVILFGILITLWAAVAWHRYVLLNEAPNGWLPVWNGNAVVSYLRQWIKFLLLASIVVFISIFILIPMMKAGSVSQSPLLAIFFVIGFEVFLGFLFLRVCLVFPAAAVGQPIGLFDSWDDTKPYAKALIFITIVEAVIGSALRIISDLFGAGLIGTIVNSATDILFALWTLSVITTLYGFIIEGRSLEGE